MLNGIFHAQSSQPNMTQCLCPSGISLCVCWRNVQLIQTVTAVDPDEPLGGQHFYYSLAPEAANNPNFTLRDNQGRGNIGTKENPDYLIIALIFSIYKGNIGF